MREPRINAPRRAAFSDGVSIGLAVLLLLVWGLALLLGGPGAPFDSALLSHFYAGPHPAVATLFAVMTQLGGYLFLIVAVVAAAAYLFGHGRRHDAVFLILSVFSGRVLVEVQKYEFARPRPTLDHLVDVTTMSFPSAHSANSMISYLMLAILLSGRRVAIAAALALSIAIGCSRMALGVHWPTDIVGGWAFGLLWVGLALRFFAPKTA